MSRQDTRPTIDAALVRRLIDTQFPHWAGLPLRLLEPAGSDHVIYRLGPELSVRLPRHSGAIGQAEKDWRWLPRLAPQLPLAIPVPAGVGRPDFGYPWPWAVAHWMPGEPATIEQLADSAETAHTLAEFLVALQGFAPTAELRTEQPLADRDRDTRAAIAQVDGVFPIAAMTELWDAALAAPAWGPPVWFHGDFHIGNLLTVSGRLSAVIDFGSLGIGDPACDMTIAFNMMTARSRAAFRSVLNVDDATWLRGRGWALSTGLNAYTSYAAVSSQVAERTTRQITEALIG